MLGLETRVRHTEYCYDAQVIEAPYVVDEQILGNMPHPTCVCSEADRLHSDWKALAAMVKRAADAKIIPAGSLQALRDYARSKAALDDLHERIRLASCEEQNAEPTTGRCPICRMEDGP